LDRAWFGKASQYSYPGIEVPMPTRNGNLTRDEREYEEKLAALRTAIAEGDNGGDAEEGVFESLHTYINKLAAEKTQGHS
jgi:hypothetical protein